MDTDGLDDATRRLYAAPPDDFTSLRRELAAQAADDDAAKAIGKLRKPTNAARIVNAMAADDPAAAQRLRDLGDQMRSAQDDFDATRMRELTEQRRTLVGECAKRAFELAGVDQPGSTLRDDVLGTLDAAVADPDVAARLGALQRPEHFSGFGFISTDQSPPQLRLMQGGRDAQPAKNAQPAKKQPKLTATERRKRRRALDDAQERFDAADAALDDATRAERDAARALTRRERELAKAKEALDAARATLDDSHAAVKDAKTERREARSALDREQRRSPD